MQYVVLRHTPSPSAPLPESRGPHFDWMFEVDSALWTWAIESFPPHDQPTSGKALRLPDHRVAYLQYEGPLTNDRGVVQRVESGTCILRTQKENLITFELSGGRQGRLRFQRMRSGANAEDNPTWFWDFRPDRAEAS